jgi:hypothetical protein
MRCNPVGWFELYVEDIDRATKFYETVLGTKLEKLDAPMDNLQMMAFPMSMESPGASGALCKMDGVTARRRRNADLLQLGRLRCRSVPDRRCRRHDSDAEDVRLANTDSSPWESTLKATCLDCIHRQLHRHRYLYIDSRSNPCLQNRKLNTNGLIS